jgi:hypothetical protein
MVACWLGLPLALGLVSLGCGRLLEVASGARIPGALLIPAGLAVAVLVAQATTLTDATAELTLPLLVVLGALGLLLMAHRQTGPLDGWALAAAAGVYAAVAAPVVLSGDATFAGYIKLDDTATWLALSDRLLEHGREVHGLAPSTYEATVDNYLGSGYPVGAFLPLSIAHALLRQDAAWLVQPLLAFLASMLALSLYELPRDLLSSPRTRAVVAFVAAQPALLYAYSLWGGIKELAAALLLALLAALLVPALRFTDRARLAHALPRLRALLPACAAAAGTLAVGSVGAGVWLIAPIALLVALWARRAGLGVSALHGAKMVALTMALSIPALLSAGTFLSPSGRETLTSDRELGNLSEPLSLLQALGIWPAGDFRFDPTRLTTTYLLLGALALAIVVGVAAALRGRALALIVFLLGAAGGCLIVVALGSPWVDAKAMAVASPAFVLLALIGAVVLWRDGPRFAGALVALAIAFGVLWSNALAYHDVNLAPRDRLGELQTIGERIAGEGPTLMTDYEPFGARHFLRDADPEGASEFRRRSVLLRNDKELEKLAVADIDEFQLPSVLVYRTLVLRRSGVASRPPSPYRLVERHRYYEVWQRPARIPRILEHVPLGDRVHPVATPSCRRVLRIATRAGPGARIAAVVRPPAGLVQLSKLPHPASWDRDPRDPKVLYPRGDGRITARLLVSVSGLYGVWVGGSFRGRLAVSIDGKHVGELRHQLSHSGEYVPFGETPLQPGTRTVTLDYESSDLHPGSGGAPFELGPLVLSLTTADTPVTYVRTERATSLCGKPLDWIEAVVR